MSQSLGGFQSEAEREKEAAICPVCGVSVNKTKYKPAPQI